MELFKLFATISLKDSDFTSGLGKASDAMSKFGSATEKAVDLVIKSVAAAATAVYGLGTAAVKIGMEFEQAMADIAAITGSTDDELAFMESTIRNLAKEFGVSATEMTKAFKYIAEAGGDADQMVEDMRGALLLATAAGEDFRGVTISMAAMMKSFGDETTDAEHIANVMAATISAVNTDVMQLAKAFEYAGPAAGIMGYAVDDVALALSMMAESGIVADKAGTALRTVLSELAKGMVRVAGNTEVYEIATTNLDGSMRPLYDVIVDMQDAFSHLTEAEKAVAAEAIGGKTAMSGLLAIVNTSAEDMEWLTDTIYGAQDAFDGMGQAAGMAAIQQDTLKGAISKLKSSVQDIGITFYQSIDNPLKDVVNKAQGYVNELAQAFDEGGLAGAVAKIGTILADVVTSLAEQAPEFIQVGVNLISALVQGITENRDIIITGAITAFTALMDGVREMLPQLVPLAVDIIMALADGFIQYADLILTAGINLITQLIVGIAEKLPDLIPQAQEAIMNIVRGLSDNLPLILKAGMEILAELVHGIADMLPELIPVAIDAVVLLVETLIDNIDMLIDAAIAITLALANGLIDSLPKLIEKAPEIIIKFVDALIENTPKLFKASAEIIGKLVKGLWDAVPVLWNAVFDLINKLGEKLGLDLTAITDAGRRIIEGFWNGMSSMWGWLTDKVTNMFSSVVNSVKSLFGISSPSKVFAGIGKNLGEGFVDGVESMAGKVERIVGDVFGGLGGEVGYNIGVGAHGAILALQAASQQGEGRGAFTYSPTNIFYVNRELDVERISRELDRQAERAMRQRGLATV